MANENLYEVVVGLEVHAQLLTNSKLFCGDSTAFGAEPNTQISPITLGHPGTLPKINRKAVEFAVKTGLACHCEIEHHNYFARKNYFYPDLPKGYQVSQHTTPVCKNGFINIQTAGGEKKIRLNRIHLEEDAGKSLHDIDPENTCVDYNRAGTPLIEIVSEPDLRSGDEAFAYLTEVRKLLRYLAVCDGNMEEGSLRCDANISVRKKGETKLGTKVEVKNLNSIRNLKRAIEAEANRLIEVLEKGGTVAQQTRSFDANSGTTFAIRDKEDADDYRYFPEPDLVPFHLRQEFIDSVRMTIPELPGEKIKRYTGELNLSGYDALLLTEEKMFADYFENVISFLPAESGEARPPARAGTDGDDPLGQGQGMRKACANWMLGPVKSWMNESGKEINDFPIKADRLAQIVVLTSNGKLSFSAASAKLFTYLLNHPDENPEEAAKKLNLLQESDMSAILPLVDAVLEKFADKAAEYKKGKKGLLAFFVGEVIKRSKGKADPKMVNDIIIGKLSG